MRTTALLTLLFLYCTTPFMSLAAPEDEVQINAVVPAQPTDFDISMVANDPTDPVGQSHEIPFTISYANNLSYATTVTVVASWTRGTVDGDSDPSVTIAHYLDGSATDGYNGSSPVIDTNNRTITWTIPSLPGNGAINTVDFSLISSASYTNDLPVNFSITSVLNGPGTTTNGNTITRQFYSEPVAPSPTPDVTSTPFQPTSAPGTPNPTSTPNQSSDLAIQNISIQTIQSTSATVALTTNEAATGVISYGTSPRLLSTSASSTRSSRFHTFNLSGLKPNTKYYFRITASQSGSEVVSDLYSFTTTTQNSQFSPDITSIVVTSNDVILSSGNETVSSSESAIIPVILLPTESLYEFRFSIPNSSGIKNIEAFLRNRTVLAANSDELFQTELIQLIETSPGVYLGRLRSPKEPGIYELVLRISDNKGNIVEKMVSVISVSKPLAVFSNKSKLPVEGAEVTFYIYNNKTKKYDRIRQNNLSIPNPSYTSNIGEISLAFPRGKYKAVVRTLNFKEKEVFFSVGQTINDSYPQIYLEESGFSIFGLLSYLGGSISNVLFVSSSDYLSALTSSQRILHLTSVIILISLLFITFYSASKRMQLPFLSIPTYLLYHLRNKKHDSTVIKGEISDHSDKGLAHANIYLTDPDSDKIIAHGVTNSQGRFSILAPEGNYRLSVLKEGYQSLTLFENLPLEKELQLTVVKNDEKKHLTGRLGDFIGFVAEGSFELILFGSLVIITAIALKTAWIDTLPILLIALLNVYLWYGHHRKRDINLS